MSSTLPGSFDRIGVNLPEIEALLYTREAEFPHFLVTNISVSLRWERNVPALWGERVVVWVTLPENAPNIELYDFIDLFRGSDLVILWSFP